MIFREKFIDIFNEIARVFIVLYVLYVRAAGRNPSRHSRQNVAYHYGIPYCTHRRDRRDS